MVLSNLALERFFLDGKDISKEDMVNLRRKIGYSIQGTSLFPHLSVKDNISYVLKLINKKKIRIK